MPDGRKSIEFSPAVSQAVLKAMVVTIRKWRLHRQTGSSVEAGHPTQTTGHAGAAFAVVGVGG